VDSAAPVRRRPRVLASNMLIAATTRRRCRVPLHAHEYQGTIRGLRAGCVCHRLEAGTRRSGPRVGILASHHVMDLGGRLPGWGPGRVCVSPETAKVMGARVHVAPDRGVGAGAGLAPARASGVSAAELAEVALRITSGRYPDRGHPSAFCKMAALGEVVIARDEWTRSPSRGQLRSFSEKRGRSSAPSP